MAETKGVVLPRKDSQAHAVKKLPPYENVYVICVGINDYPNMPVLRYAEPDARELAAALNTVYGFKTEFLLGSKATRKALLTAIADIESKITERDDLIVYFSGHGITVDEPGEGSYGEFARSGYLMMYPVNDAEAKSPEGLAHNALNMKQLAQNLIKVNARHRILILDSCFSGHAASYVKARTYVDYDEDVMLSKPTVQVMTAGRDKEEALEFDDIKHGVFTYELLQLINKDKEDRQYHTMEEIFGPLRKNVIMRARERSKRLTPTLRELIESDGEFVFIPNDLHDQWTSAATPALAPEAVATRGVPKAVTDDEVAAFYEEASTYDSEHASESEKKEWQVRVEKMEERASTGDERAMTVLVKAYGDGIGVEKDEELAYQWARESYDTGKPSGLMGLSQAFKNGYSVARDLTKASELTELFFSEGGVWDSALEGTTAVAKNAAASVGYFFKKGKNKLLGADGHDSGGTSLASHLDDVEEYSEEDAWKKAKSRIDRLTGELEYIEENEFLTETKSKLIAELSEQAELIVGFIGEKDKDSVRLHCEKSRAVIKRIEDLDDDPEKD